MILINACIKSNKFIGASKIAGRRISIFLLYSRLLPLLFLMVNIIISSASAQTIWFCPKDPLSRGPQSESGTVDYMDMFSLQARWKKAASVVGVFEVGSEFVTRMSTGDQKRLYKNIVRRHIALAAGVGPLTGGGGRCGYHVEGYSSAGEPLLIAERIKMLGGELKYADMDEPLFFGHDFDGPNACHASIEEIAQDVAIKVAQIRAVFPNIEIGDAEPLAQFEGPKGVGELEHWFAAYEAAVGRPLAFFQLDIDWKRNWQKQILPLARILRRHRIKFGVMYNGNPQSPSDIAWTTEAEAHFKAFESDGRKPPDQAIFQSWVSHPSLALPETKPGTFTNLILRYHEWQRVRDK